MWITFQRPFLRFTLDTRYKNRYKYSFHYIMPIIHAKDNFFFIDCAKINYIFKHTLVLIKMREG